MLIILILGILLWWIWRKIKEKKRKLKKEVTEAEEVFYRAFVALKKEIEEQVEIFDSLPGLSPKRKKFATI